MPRRKNNRSRKQKKSRSMPESNLFVHSGQIQYGKTSYNTQDVHNFHLKIVSTGIASSGTGIITVALNLNDPSNATNWVSGISTLFDSYRVRSVEITWIPANPNDATNTFRPLYVITDFDSTSVGVTTGDQALQFDSTRIYDLSKPFVHTIVVPSMTAANNPTGWLDTAAPISQGAVQLLATGLSNTITYGSYIIQYNIQCTSIR